MATLPTGETSFVTPSGNLKVKVDGKEIEVPRTTPDPITGKPLPTTMIQACALAQVDVPHYCYHPKLPVAGNCRMCLVEFATPSLGPDRKPLIKPDGTAKVTRSPRPAIACATPISPGVEIYTTTPGVTQMREAVLEFLLINHPLDCPICDQAGECKLQEYSVDYGKSASRFVEAKVHKPKRVDLGPRIVLDDERCILCTRCIRFTRDIVGDDALGIVSRGSHSTLTAYPGRIFDNNYTLNTVDICPVGALTSRDFRFQMRVWFLKETKSICTSCATGCNIVIGSRQEKVYRFEPRQNDAVNSNWMCDYGRLNYKWIGRGDRLRELRVGQASRLPLTTPNSKQTSSSTLQSVAAKADSTWLQGLKDPPPPHALRDDQLRHSSSEGGSSMVRGLPRRSVAKAGPWSVVGGSADTWLPMLKEISEKLKKAAPGSVGIIASARQTNEELYLLAKLAKKLGAVTDSVPRMAEGDKLLLNPDRNPNSLGARLMGIAADPIGSNLSKIAEAIRSGRIRTLIVFGEDVTRHGIGAELIAKLETLIVSDILPNETTRAAHYLLPGCAHVEKRGTFTNVKGRVQKFMKAVEPPGDARPEWEFLHELVLAVAGQDGYVSIEGLFNQMASDVPAFKGMTWAGLGDTGTNLLARP